MSEIFYYIVERVSCTNNKSSKEIIGYVTNPDSADSINSNGAFELMGWMAINEAELSNGNLNACSFFDDKSYSEVYFCCWKNTNIDGMGINEITDLSTVGVVI